jgi:hypothetical protein
LVPKRILNRIHRVLSKLHREQNSSHPPEDQQKNRKRGFSKKRSKGKEGSGREKHGELGEEATHR